MSILSLHEHYKILQRGAILVWLPPQLCFSSKLTICRRSHKREIQSWWFMAVDYFSPAGIQSVYLRSAPSFFVPLPSFLPNVSSATKRKSACQVHNFRLIKPAPCLVSLSQWFTHSVNHTRTSFELSVPWTTTCLQVPIHACAHMSEQMCNLQPYLATAYAMFLLATDFCACHIPTTWGANGLSGTKIRCVIILMSCPPSSYVPS